MSKKLWGSVLSVVGIINGLLLLIWINRLYYSVVVAKIHQGHFHEALTVRIVFALLAWLALSAGAIWAASLYGFLKNREWAWFWGLLAATLQILAGFFPFIPSASVHIFAKTFIIFWIALAMWFVMMRFGKVPARALWISFLAGLAYIFSFIDGVGTIARYWLYAKKFSYAIYGLTQMVNWWAAAGFVVFIMALTKGKKWAIPLGIFTTSLSMLVGYPLGIADAIRIGRFSLFLIAPITSTLILLLILLFLREEELV